MTAEPDLLPCPGCNGASVRVIGGPGTKGGPQYWAGCDYCRWRTWGNTEAEAIAAWNRRATAARDAEVEALRAEVETLRDGLDYLRQMQGVPDVLELRAKAARAERLAEALRRYRNEVPLGHQPHMLAHVVDDMLNPTAAQEAKESFWPKLPGSGGPDWTGHD